MKKLFLTLGLGCLTLPLESAALRQAVSRFSVAARAGMHLRQTLQRVEPVAPQTVRGIATLSRSNKSYEGDKIKMSDFDLFISLAVGVVFGAVSDQLSQKMVLKGKKDREHTFQEMLIHLNNLFKSGKHELGVETIVNFLSDYITSTDPNYDLYVWDIHSVMSTVPEDLKKLVRKKIFKLLTVENKKKHKVFLDLSYRYHETCYDETCYDETIQQDFRLYFDTFIDVLLFEDIYPFFRNVLPWISMVDNAYYKLALLKKAYGKTPDRLEGISYSALCEKFFNSLTLEEQKRTDNFFRVLSPEERKVFRRRYIEKFISEISAKEFCHQISFDLEELEKKELRLLFLEKIECTKRIKTDDDFVFFNTIIEEVLPLLSFDQADTYAHKVLELLKDVRLQDENTENLKKLIEAKKALELKLVSYLSSSVEQKKQVEAFLGNPLLVELLDNPNRSEHYGPLFSRFGLKFLGHFSKTNCLIGDHPNFENLFPFIRECVAKQYAQDRMVYFHGQASAWMILSDIYAVLYEVARETQLPENFIFLRFFGESYLKETDVHHFIKEHPGAKDHPSVLFVNLHLMANVKNDNSLNYAQDNYNQNVGGDKGKNGFFTLEKFFQKTSSFFASEGFLNEFEICKNDLKKLKTLHERAIKSQGDYGRLMVISMPKPLASKISYSCWARGLIRSISIDGEHTLDPVKIAERYDQVDFFNQYGILLTNEMLNPQEAAKAGVQMESFEPAIYWETAEAQEYKAALQEFKAKLTRLRDARKK